jgi:hypothetical protein
MSHEEPAAARLDNATKRNKATMVRATIAMAEELCDRSNAKS